MKEMMQLHHKSKSLLLRYAFYNCVGKDAYFKSQFARFKPFLWAQARFMMSKIIKPINNIVIKLFYERHENKAGSGF